MTNSEIGDHFSLLSKLMDIHGENSFKTKAYGSAAFNIERLPKQITDMDDAELFSIRGIGEAIGKKIRELIATGKLHLLDEIIENTPPGIIEMLDIKGLGPKKIAIIWKDLGVESVGELEYACNENRLVTLKGFGQKTQESILQNIAYIRQNAGFRLWADAMKQATVLTGHLKKTFTDADFLLTGSIRRQVEVIETIELVSDIESTTLLKLLKSSPNVTVTEEHPDYITMSLQGYPTIKIYLADKEQLLKTQFITTGSPEFMNAFTKDFAIPEGTTSEEELFAKNRLAYIHPAMRETPAVLAIAAKHEMPVLITPKDIKGIIHSHSTYSDGNNTLEQMAKAARDKGYEYLVISDHSQAATYANGLTPDRIAFQHREIDELNEKLAPFKIFKSIEADILGTGELDYYPILLATFDLVIASVHSNLKMSEERAMERVMKAIQNPYTSILGHPTGRLLLSRKGYPLDHKKIIDACAAHHVVIEINAHPRRLDLDWRWIAYAIEKNVLLSIDPDAHSIDGFDDVQYGVIAAQKGGLTAKHNLSSFSLKEFKAFVEQQKGKRG